MIFSCVVCLPPYPPKQDYTLMKANNPPSPDTITSLHSDEKPTTSVISINCFKIKMIISVGT